MKKYGYDVFTSSMQRISDFPLPDFRKKSYDEQVIEPYLVRFMMLKADNRARRKVLCCNKCKKTKKQLKRFHSAQHALKIFKHLWSISRIPVREIDQIIMHTTICIWSHPQLLTSNLGYIAPVCKFVLITLQLLSFSPKEAAFYLPLEVCQKQRGLQLNSNLSHLCHSGTHSQGHPGRYLVLHAHCPYHVKGDRKNRALSVKKVAKVPPTTNEIPVRFRNERWATNKALHYTSSADS